MVKKRIEERVCRNCGKIIIGRRSDAIICRDCRRKAQEESSQRIKEKEKEERILKKVEGSWVKRHIEKEKVEKILEALRKGELEESEKLKKDLSDIFRITPSQLREICGFGQFDWDKKWEEEDLKQIREFIEEKIEEEKEKVKKEVEEKRWGFRSSFDIFQ